MSTPAAAVASLLELPGRVFRGAAVETMIKEARTAHQRGTQRTVASMTQLLLETAEHSADVEVVDDVCQGMCFSAVQLARHCKEITSCVLRLAQACCIWQQMVFVIPHRC